MTLSEATARLSSLSVTPVQLSLTPNWQTAAAGFTFMISLNRFLSDLNISSRAIFKTHQMRQLSSLTGANNPIPFTQQMALTRATYHM